MLKKDELFTPKLCESLFEVQDWGRFGPHATKRHHPRSSIIYNMLGNKINEGQGKRIARQLSKLDNTIRAEMLYEAQSLEEQ